LGERGRVVNTRGVAKYSDFGPIEGYELSVGTKIGDLE